MKKLIVILIILALLGAGFYLFKHAPSFSAPPPSSNTPTKSVVSIRLGSSADLSGIKMTPRVVVEDSRCPTDVQCIQAGTVRVSVDFSSSNMATTTQIFKLNEPTTLLGLNITLTEVYPAKLSTVPLTAKDYLLFFNVEKL